MKIFIDGRDSMLTCAEPSALQGVFKEIKDRLGTEDKVVEKIECGGEKMDFKKLLSGEDVLSVSTDVHITTKPIAEVMWGALKEVQEHLPSLINALREMVMLFRRDKIMDGAKVFKELSPFFKLLVLGLLSVQNYRKEELQFNCSVFSNALTDASQALHDKDYVLFCDTIEYKVIPQLEELRDFLQAKMSEGKK